MKSLLVLVMGLMLCSCAPSRVGCGRYTERGWVRQIWINKGGFNYGYSITLEREYPKGEVAQIVVQDGHAPTVWQGEYVAITIQQQNWGDNDCQNIEQGVNIVSVQRLD